jgi:hypothetical protein
VRIKTNLTLNFFCGIPIKSLIELSGEVSDIKPVKTELLLTFTLCAYMKRFVKERTGICTISKSVEVLPHVWLMQENL